MTNAELIAAYDADEAIVGPRIFAANPEKEHAAQRIAIEALRTLVDLGRSVQEWNEMPEPAWRARAMASAARVQGHSLSAEDRFAAASIGTCYFEQGYQQLMDGTGRPLVTFTRTGGIQE